MSLKNNASEYIISNGVWYKRNARTNFTIICRKKGYHKKEPSLTCRHFVLNYCLMTIIYWNWWIACTSDNKCRGMFSFILQLNT